MSASMNLLPSAKVKLFPQSLHLACQVHSRTPAGIRTFKVCVVVWPVRGLVRWRETVRSEPFSTSSSVTRISLFEFDGHGAVLRTVLNH